MVRGPNLQWTSSSLDKLESRLYKLKNTVHLWCINKAGGCSGTHLMPKHLSYRTRIRTYLVVVNGSRLTEV